MFLDAVVDGYFVGFSIAPAVRMMPFELLDLALLDRQTLEHKSAREDSYLTSEYRLYIYNGVIAMLNPKAGAAMSPLAKCLYAFLFSRSSVIFHQTISW